MKPLDHNECNPYDCIHKAEEMRANGWRSEDEVAAEKEAAYYEEKRRRRAVQGVMNSPGARGFADVYEGGVKVVEHDTPSMQRALRVAKLEEELLEARADQARHGELGPLQPIRNVVGDALRLLEEKDRKYGGAWRLQGYMGNLARLKSKMARLDNMLWRDPDGNGYPIPSLDIAGGEETVTDTLVDIVNIAAMMAANWNDDNRWGRGRD